MGISCMVLGNSGVSRATIYTQRILGANEDGVMGNYTLDALNRFTGDFVALFKDARLSFVNAIVENDQSQAVFLAGWENRIKNA